MPVNKGVPQLIAAEVAKNHINMKPLEVQTGKLNELKDYFTELDFSPVQSSHFSAGQLIGARYCSVQGVTAAQLRYDPNQHLDQK
ncbi:MAG: hypothetical protein ACI9B8_002041 [Sulfitobacter sp.]|jgi:hypothetical protein